MKLENYFFFILSIVTFIYALRVSIIMFIDRNKVIEVQGKIIEIDIVFPEIMKHRNVKLATFEYYVEGRRYVSKNQLKMPLSVEVGDIRNIKYYINTPNVLYTKTYIHFYLSLITSLVCFILGLIPY